MRQLLLLRDQRVKLRFVIFLRRRLRFLFRFRFRRGGLGVAGQLAGQIVCQVDRLLPACYFSDPVPQIHRAGRSRGPSSSAPPRAAAARRSADRKSDAFARRRSTCSMCRSATWFTSFSAGSACSRLRRLIFELRSVFDCEDDALHGHVQARDQRQKKPAMQRITAPTLAHHQLQHQRQPSGDHAAGRSGNAAVPEVLEHILAPFHAASADELHQRPDQHRHEERTRHPQRHGPPVMQQQGSGSPSETRTVKCKSPRRSAHGRNVASASRNAAWI